MTVLAWWAIPIVATALALGWAAWASRSRPRPQAYDTIDDYQRFRAALASVTQKDGSPIPSDSPGAPPRPGVAHDDQR